ncbi:MAG TPA: SOS response-associated peptidase family protein [Chitinophaga sp.]|uniref:SOS response-associated peptidase n=1 Tax=Chitinophaga sp. TaxID=1869181 RepID=UPI002C8420EA|nr:SOS response-associated peptidase family protein [Chitinophaga sp.]HVI46811.1 SOS response-associated peptidase family protein [Chitinophaga sp.]
MCYDISLHVDVKETLKAFPGLVVKTDKLFDPASMIHMEGYVFPEYPIILHNPGEGLVLDTFEWGVLPTYIKNDPKKFAEMRSNMVNCRSERIFEDKRSVWYRLRNNRCLIPVTATFDHRKIDKWKRKIPYLVRPKGRLPFYIPGLYQVADMVDGDGVIYSSASFTLCTRSANQVMRLIHNDGNNKWRMPLFVTKEMADAWVSPDLTESAIQEIINYEMPDDDLEYYTVYTIRGGKLRPDGKDKDELWQWPGLPPLGNDDPGTAKQILE